jgi:histidine triad (HIT) family protein
MTYPQAMDDTMQQASDCVFCKIVRGGAPAHRIYEDERTVVFMDINPVTEGHVLVVTKEHFPTLFEATPEALQAVMCAAKRVAHAIHAVLDPAGLMVFQLNGAAAFQSVFHYHMHLVPRAAGEPLALHGRVRGDPARLQRLAERFAAALR